MSDTTNGAESAEGTTNAAHNIANITHMLRGCAVEMIQIKSERGELNERAGDIRKRLKDAGLEPKALEFAVRVQEMEAEGRENYLESLRLSFDALAIGGQGEMFGGHTPDQPSAP